MAQFKQSYTTQNNGPMRSSNTNDFKQNQSSKLPVDLYNPQFTSKYNLTLQILGLTEKDPILNILINHLINENITSLNQLSD